MVAVGHLAGLYGLPTEIFHRLIADKFKTKDPSVTKMNIAAFDAGRDAGAEVLQLDLNVLGPPPAKKKTGNSSNDLVMMSGNEAIVRGCIEAGIENFFGYPITPATTIMERLATEMPKHGGRLLQTEDEISAIAATMGAGYAGTRAATATSGPGFALMTEMMGLGAIAEVPSVIFVSQRGGPSTGMPTKTEQSDLNLAVFGVAGDGQRIVLAPTNVEGCWKCAGKAFEMAEKYQTPVVVLLDLYLSNRYEAVAFPDISPFNGNLNKVPKEKELGEGYRRYRHARDHVSPRSIPGEAGGLHTVTGLEHNERGRPSDLAEVHQAMSEKRHEKLKPAINHPGITISKRFGDTGDVDVGIIGWGSTFGEILEAMIEARREGIRCAAMKVVMLSPLPIDAINRFLGSSRHVLVPEVNYEGQFAHLITGATGRTVNRLNRVQGTPMEVNAIVDEIRRLAGRGAKAKKAAAE